MLRGVFRTGYRGVARTALRHAGRQTQGVRYAGVSSQFSSMAEIKALRERTGAPILECKKALADDEVGGDLEKAIDWLRKKGVAAASKRADKDAAEGLVSVAVSDCGKIGACVEMNSETDFVARNELFQGLLREITQKSLTLSVEGSDGHTDVTEAVLGEYADQVAELGGKVRENIKLARAEVVQLSGDDDIVVSYVHNALASGMGTMGCLVGIAGNGELAGFGQQVALHVAAAGPLYLDETHVPSDDVERESAVLREQALASGKPENIVDKMITGRIRKFFAETCLVDQEFVVDDTKRSVKKVAKEAGNDVKGFVWRKVGNGSASGW